MVTYRARAALLLTVVLWASAFPAIQAAVPGFGWAGLGLLRLVVASTALALVAPFAGVRRPALRHLPLILLAAVTGMAGYQLLLNYGELRVTGGTASLIVVTNPIYAAVIAVAFLGERVTRNQVIGGVVALGGVAAIAVKQGGLHLEKYALIVLAAAVAFGSYHAIIKPLLDHYTGLEVTAYATWAGTILLLPATDTLIHSIPHAGAEAWGSTIFLGLLPSALGFVAWGYGVARLPVTVATAAIYLVPPIALLVGYIWLGDRPNWVELAGGAVAIAGVAIANRQSRSAKAPEETPTPQNAEVTP